MHAYNSCQAMQPHANAVMHVRESARTNLCLGVATTYSRTADP